MANSSSAICFTGRLVLPHLDGPCLSEGASMPLLRSARWLLLVSLACLSVVGCGRSDGPVTYPISGTVTYGGQIVPAGSVTLLPDTSQGNSGTAVSMEIVDGKFDSKSADRGHVGGPHVVRIVGLDGQGDDDLFPKGQMLFPDYKTTIDLPMEPSTQELAVPDDHKMPSRSGRVDHGP